MQEAESKKDNIWHPFTQMKLAAEPIKVERAKGTILHTEDGEEIIDAISSWWVTLHGHSHPYIAEKVKQQLLNLDHCIFADFTHSPAEELIERLMQHLPSEMDKAFFSDNGSTSVEVAIKMAIQYWHNQDIKKPKIVALQGAYHGDTFGAMSAAERSPFSAAFDDYMFDVIHLAPPCNKEDINAFKTLCESGEVGAFIYEPLLQGAGGMVMYSKEGLNAWLEIAKANDVICIADEVMTGFFRTGSFFASLQMETQPDIMCLSKGLTGGVLPMSLTVCNAKIYKAFWSDDRMKTFFHGHSFTGNPVGCATALASLDLLEKQETQDSIQRIIESHSAFANELKQSNKVENVRQIGTVIAFDVVTEETSGYFNSNRDALYKAFLEQGVLLRPLGNVVYILAPYSITNEELMKVYGVIRDVVLRNQLT